MNFMKSIRISNQMMLIAVISMIGFMLVAAVYLFSSMRLNTIQMEQQRALAGQQLITDIKYE